MIDEKGKRKAGFDEAESVEVEFGDGQSWFLPRPRYTLRAVREGTSAKSRLCSSFGPEFDALMEAAQSNEDYYGGAGMVAADLLMRNYDLTEDEAWSLLSFDFDPDDPRVFVDNWPGWAIAVANGRHAPKPPAVGSGSAS